MTKGSSLIPVILALTVGLGSASVSTQVAAAVESFVIQDIQVEGLRRTEAGTIFSYLPVRVGDTFTQERALQSIKALYATGFFDDVRLSTRGAVLVVSVVERPAIGSVSFEGIQEFDSETLGKALKQVGIGESKIFDRSLLEKAEQELKRQYLSRGKYGAQVQTDVVELPRNRVGINFRVEEGSTASIAQLKIIGNTDFSEDELLGEFDLSTTGLFSWYSKNDQYSRQKLSADLEALRSFYLNSGYADFNIESTQVQVAPNKQDVFITIVVKEGNKFRFGNIELTGTLLDREAELQELVQVQQGDTFSRQTLSKTAKAIRDRLGNYGYAFANANVIPDINRETQLVNVNIAVDPGKRVYVRRINIGGNDRTRDEVIRRELRQYEASFYDAEKINLSRDRVDRLGYFKEVNVESNAVPGTADQVDVNLTVEEKPTGNLLVGAGINSTDALVLQAAIQQQNLFGTGKTVGLELNTSKTNRTVSFSQTDPYFTIDGVSRTINVFDRTTDSQELSLGDYKLQTTGAGISFGYPVSEFERINFGASYEGTHLEVDQNSPVRYQQYVSDFGNDSYAILLTGGYTYDSRDSAIVPTEGRLGRIFIELATPLGDQEFVKTTLQEQRFFPLWDGYTLGLNGEVVLGGGLGASPFPIFRNVYAGGIGTVRGYKAASLGPRDTDDRPTGGARRITANAEFIFPVPGFKDRTFRAFGFFDAGNVYQSTEDVRLEDLRYSTGFGISWISPVGPLKFSYGFPLNKEPSDDLQRVQFTIGTGF